MTKAPAFPLPRGWYFGWRDAPAVSVSGYHGWREALWAWQQQMFLRGWDIKPDGLYGQQTHNVARAFQFSKGLKVDGKIGRDTWRAAFARPVL